MDKHAIKIIALDFDGTIVTNKYPEVGEPIEKNIKKIHEEQGQGAKVILWTNRCGRYLKDAVDFCRANGIRLDAVNENLPEVIAEFGTDCRKIFANEYWDDRAVWMSEYDIGILSDGYHTFNDLYDQRRYLSAALFNAYKELAWKSRKHSDGQECFAGGWFIVGIDTPLGPYTYHYENQYWDMFNCKELDMAPEWDGHTDKDVNRLISLGMEGSVPEAVEEKVACCRESKKSTNRKIFSQAMYYIFRFFRRLRNRVQDILKKPSNMQSWAEREVEIASKRERTDSETPDGEWDYGCACYDSALKAYRSLMKDGHSGFSIGMTKHILVRLIEGKPLTPIEDTPDVWNDISDMSGLKGEEVNYQCKRMSSLFKYVYADGSIKYRDIDNHYCVDMASQSTYHSSLVQRIIDEMFPITMPYMPDKPIKVYCSEVLTDRKNGDFDTMGIFFILKPNGENIEINRFFKESNSATGWDEIDSGEWNQRVLLAKKLKEAK